MAEESMMAPSALSEEAVVSLVGGEDAIHDSFFYLCGRLLSKKTVVIPSFSAAISNVWGLKERVLIRQEEEDIFVFQFKDSEVKNRILSSGPWFYNNSMLLLADYDGISDLGAAPLHLLEVWVAVKGLRIAMRNEKALTLIGRALGSFVRVDQGAVQRKDPIQRIRVVQDVRRRIWARRTFQFSSTVSVVVELQYEKCHGLCAACGFFGHGGGICDGRLEAEARAALALGVSDRAVDANPGGLAASEAAVSGLVAGSEMLVTVGLGAPEVSGVAKVAGTLVMGSGSPAARSSVRVPENSAANPNFELGLTGGLTGIAQHGLGSGLHGIGPGLHGTGPDYFAAGANINGLAVGVSSEQHCTLGVKRKSFKPRLAFIPPEFHLGELVEVPISLGTAPRKKGRPVGRRNKRTLRNEKDEGNNDGANINSNSPGKELAIV